MKKIIFTIFLLFWTGYLLLHSASAQIPTIEKTPSSEPKTTKISSDTPQIIQNLKEKIATKVAELQKTDKKIIKGTILSINDNELKIIDVNKQIFTVLIDELTVDLFQLRAGSRQKIEKKDLKENLHVLVYGTVVENSLTPDRIYTYTPELFFEGRLQNVNSDYSIEIVSNNGSIRTFDIEISTRQKLFDKKAMKIVTSGFSKYKVGDYVIASYSDETNSTRSSALRTIIIPQESIE